MKPMSDREKRDLLCLYLKDKGCWIAFIRNTYDFIHKHKCGKVELGYDPFEVLWENHLSYIIECAFNWGDTSESRTFWKRISKEWWEVCDE